MKKIKTRIILITFFILSACAVSIAQKPRFNSMSEALTEFMNSKMVINNFTNWNHQQGSSRVLIDLENLLNGDTINIWKGYKISILKDGSLVDSLKLFDAHYLLKNRCNYYVLMARKEEEETTVIALRHACTNKVSSTKITERNRMFYLGKIRNSVW
jgi:hypothetical protein